MKLFKNGFILLILLSLSGCSAIETRSIGGNYDDKGEFGHPYSGTQQSIYNLPIGLIDSCSKMLCLPFPLYVVDLGFSVALDTLFLPVDIVTPDNYDRSQVVVFHADYFNQ